MAKWFGKIGYNSEMVETSPGVWEPSIVEREYYGDVIRNSTRWSTTSDSTNDKLNLSNRISIVADQFAYQNFQSMLYVEFMGVKWKITDVEVQHPRLIFSMGGLYNGEQIEPTE